jgi:flagellar L-ring protein precursor FlgH
MKQYLSIIILLFSALAFSEIIEKCENPGSIWSDDVSEAWLDHVACKKGDVITIRVSEKGVANFSANTNYAKSDANILKQLLNLKKLDRRFPMSNSVDSSNGGKGSTDQSSSLVVNLSAIVDEELPGNRLRIIAKREVKVNREIQCYYLEGIIRTYDISSDNTISSEYIADAKIYATAKGGVAARQRRGFMTEVLDWLF